MPTSFPPRYFCKPAYTGQCYFECKLSDIVCISIISMHKKWRQAYILGEESLQWSSNYQQIQLLNVCHRYSWLNFSTSIIRKTSETNQHAYYSVYSLKPPYLKKNAYINACLSVYLPYPVKFGRVHDLFPRGLFPQAPGVGLWKIHQSFVGNQST